MKLPQNKAIRTLLWCCLGALTIIILVGGWYFTGKLFTYAPTQAARSFVEAIGSGDTESAYQQTSSVFKEYTTLEQLEGLTTKYPFMLSLSDISFTSWSMATGEPAVIGGYVTGSDGTKARISVELTKEESEWRVSYMEVFPE